MVYHINKQTVCSMVLSNVLLVPVSSGPTGPGAVYSSLQYIYVCLYVVLHSDPHMLRANIKPVHAVNYLTALATQKYHAFHKYIIKEVTSFIASHRLT